MGAKCSANAISLSKDVIALLRAEAAAHHPYECCGILLGKGEHISTALPAANVHPRPQTHFEIDPQLLIEAHRAARQGGLQVLGYYHSHPAGPAQPSSTDRACAARDGRVWAIIGSDGAIMLWRDCEDGFERLSSREEGL